MSKRKYKEFKKGDVIRTNPEEGFYGIAVVLDDGKELEIDTGKFSYPMCHIAMGSAGRFCRALSVAGGHILKQTMLGRHYTRKNEGCHFIIFSDTVITGWYFYS